MAKLKEHWATKMLTKRINRFNKGPLLPKFLRLPSVIELGKSKTNYLPIEGFCEEGAYTWKKYNEEMRKDYPIKFFLYYTFNYWFSSNIIKPISDFKYWIRSHTIRKYHLLDLRSKVFDYNYGWLDSDTKMLLAIMKIMEDFIIEQDTANRLVWLKEESEKTKSDPQNYDYSDDIKRCKDLLAIQKWWRVERAENWKVLYDKCGDKSIGHKNYFEMENELVKEDDDVMKKLIDMRGSLWT